MGQFTVYSSADAGAPVLTGEVGKLIDVLNGCLVTGYGAKAAPAPAWTHPVATAGNIASYLQGAGCGFGFVLNDNAPNVTPAAREAWITGWESIAGVGSPVGSGGGQFPTPAQLLVSGHAVVRKSATASNVPRSWRVFADSSTMYLFIETGDTAGIMGSTVFGDVYSLNGVGDVWRCILIGKGTENTTPTGNENTFFNSVMSSAATSAQGRHMARTWSGAGASIIVGCQGDPSKCSGTDGLVQAPNGPDNAYWLAPWMVYEQTGKPIRGRLRGCYSMLQPAAGFADGQVITGAGDYAGKTFQLVKLVCGAPNANGAILIETSATVETNA